MDIPHDTWILVADGEKFLLMRNEGDEEYPNFEVITHREIKNPPTREQGTDRPGRYNDTGMGKSARAVRTKTGQHGTDVAVGKSAVEQTDWHWLGKERFAKDLAERLYDWAHRGRFNKLVVAAAPKILGVLRPAYHEEVHKRVIAEVDKDLSNHTVRKMEEILKES